MANVDLVNKQKFYLGTGVELYIQSQIYMLGYEAYKLSPDFGIDLHVTNKFEHDYNNKDFFNKFLQIKSTPVFGNGKCDFYIDEKDFELITFNVDHYLLLVVCFFESTTDPVSLSPTYLQTDDMLAAMIDSYTKNGFYNSREKKKMLDLYNSNNIDYIWINSNQLKLLKNRDFVKKTTFPDKSVKYVINLEVKDKLIQRISPIKGDWSESIISEVKNLFYLFNDFRYKDRVEGGTIFYE
ncbi:hypothetical protein [Lysinibacillus xylanilyticus]|uniref:DUF4365 domain-containing protein n=1 Tax=Lysinibacillus xylanilyticus TaxID=582475 RepID=A0ABT4ETP0_9BACI|nr:hypothetical protein [Lysinibacillus xylanilyticus]MCY9549037.1 hypothetical protein [Lysinibacillus xylanilyticus]